MGGNTPGCRAPGKRRRSEALSGRSGRNLLSSSFWPHASTPRQRSTRGLILTNANGNLIRGRVLRWRQFWAISLESFVDERVCVPWSRNDHGFWRASRAHPPPTGSTEESDVRISNTAGERFVRPTAERQGSGYMVASASIAGRDRQA